MKRGNDVGGAGFQAHIFKGLFLTVHVLETLIRVYSAKQLVNGIRGDLGIGHPQRTILEGAGIIIHTSVSAARNRQLAEIRILLVKSGNDVISACLFLSRIFPPRDETG